MAKTLKPILIPKDVTVTPEGDKLTFKGKA